MGDEGQIASEIRHPGIVLLVYLCHCDYLSWNMDVVVFLSFNFNTD